MRVANGRDDLLSESGTVSRFLEHLLFVAGDELVHDGTSNGDAGNDGRHGESEAPVANEAVEAATSVRDGFSEWRRYVRDNETGEESGDEHGTDSNLFKKSESAIRLILSDDSRTLSEMPSWIKCESVSMRAVTSPAPVLSWKETFCLSTARR